DYDGVVPNGETWTSAQLRRRQYHRRLRRRISGDLARGGRSADPKGVARGGRLRYPPASVGEARCERRYQRTERDIRLRRRRSLERSKRRAAVRSVGGR